MDLNPSSVTVEPTGRTHFSECIDTSVLFPKREELRSRPGPQSDLSVSKLQRHPSDLGALPEELIGAPQVSVGPGESASLTVTLVLILPSADHSWGNRGLSWGDLMLFQCFKVADTLPSGGS